MNYEAPKIRLIMDLRRQGITDKGVLSAVERVPREMFVPEAMRTEAYENIPLPIVRFCIGRPPRNMLATSFADWLQLAGLEMC